VSGEKSRAALAERTRLMFWFFPLSIPTSNSQTSQYSEKTAPSTPRLPHSRGEQARLRDQDRRLFPAANFREPVLNDIDGRSTRRSPSRCLSFAGVPTMRCDRNDGGLWSVQSRPRSFTRVVT
jgi:hypothetical protein